MTLHPQLQAVVDDLVALQTRLHALTDSLDHDTWSRRPDAGRWSVAENVVHLNLTAAAFVPRLRKGLEFARSRGGTVPEVYRRDVFGWLLWKILAPPPRIRAKTTAPFEPKAREDRGIVVSEFDRLQEEQIKCAREADGLPLSDVKIASPFSSRLKYNLYAALTILPQHQRRHVWQIGETIRKLSPDGLPSSLSP
jgi:hypothetical protein